MYFREDLREKLTTKGKVFISPYDHCDVIEGQVSVYVCVNSFQLKPCCSCYIIKTPDSGINLTPNALVLVSGKVDRLTSIYYICQGGIIFMTVGLYVCYQDYVNTTHSNFMKKVENYCRMTWQLLNYLSFFRGWGWVGGGVCVCGGGGGGGRGIFHGTITSVFYLSFC